MEKTTSERAPMTAKSRGANLRSKKYRFAACKILGSTGSLEGCDENFCPHSLQTGLSSEVRTPHLGHVINLKPFWPVAIPSVEQVIVVPNT